MGRADRGRGEVGVLRVVGGAAAQTVGGQRGVDIGVGVDALAGEAEVGAPRSWLRPPAGLAGWRAARVRLVLARPATQPLADAGLDPDPLEAIASVLGTLQPARGEAGILALDILAAGPRDERRLRRRLLKDATRHERPDLPAALLGPGGSGVGPRSVAQLAERRQQSRALDRKLTPGDPLMHFQLLLRISAPSCGRARDVMRSLMGSLDVLAGENHLRARGLRLGAMGSLGSDLPWRRRAFDHRVATGLINPRRRDMVCASEIAGLLKPPTVNCHAQNVVRTGGSIPEPPRGLLTFTGQPGLIPLGRIRERAGERLVGVKTGDTFFSYMAERSRYGKTQTAIGQFVHLARTGHGGLFLDPHADAIKEIKTYLTNDPAIRDRVVEINLADHEGEHPQPAWNLFALEQRTPAEAAARVEAFVDALAASLGWDERNTRALNLATQSAQALIELALRLPKELAPTIFQVPVLLSDEDFLQAAMPFLHSGTRDFFAQRFPRLPAEAVTAVTNLIDRLHASRPVAALLGSPVSSYDARRAMNEQRIVLACPAALTDPRSVVPRAAVEQAGAAVGRARAGLVVTGSLIPDAVPALLNRRPT